MKIKTEYVAFGMCNYCNGTGTFINLCKNNKGEFCTGNGYYYVSYGYRFKTKEDAINAFLSCYSYINDSNKHMYISPPYFDDFMFVECEEEASLCSLKNRGCRCFFVMQVPKSFYLGKIWEQTLDALNDTRYSDDRPSQVYDYAHKDLKSYKVYLKREDGKDDTWVEDRFEASFFTTTEAKEIAESIARTHGWATTLLLRPNEGETPVFEKGDEVYMFGRECLPYSYRYPIYKGIIGDIKVVRNKKGEKEFAYLFDNSPYWDKFTSPAELHTKDALIKKGGKFYRGMHNGYPSTGLLDLNDDTYVVFN